MIEEGERNTIRRSVLSRLCGRDGEAGWNMLVTYEEAASVCLWSSVNIKKTIKWSSIQLYRRSWSPKHKSSGLRCSCFCNLVLWWLQVTSKDFCWRFLELHHEADTGVFLWMGRWYLNHFGQVSLPIILSCALCYSSSTLVSMLRLISSSLLKVRSAAYMSIYWQKPVW